MLNSKRKGFRGEIECRDLIRDIFGTKTERQFGSGAFDGMKGDIKQWTLPDVLKPYLIEIKNEVKPRIFAYIKQCQRESNSKFMWLIAYRCPAELNVPKNFVVMMPAIEVFGLFKELEDLRRERVAKKADSKVSNGLLKNE